MLLRLLALLALAVLPLSDDLQAQVVAGVAPSVRSGADAVLDHRLTLLAAERSTPTPWRNVKGLLMVQVKVNGRDVWAMIDNACSHTLVDLNLARSVGLKPGAVVSTIDLGPTAVAERVIENVTIYVPGQMILSGQMMGVDLKAFSKLVGHPIDVIIGGDYTSKVSVLVSSSKKVLVFARPGGITPKRQAVNFPLADTNQVRGKINGKPVTLMIDLGYNGAIRLSQAAWNRIVPRGAPTTPSRTSSFDGTVRASRSVANSTFEMGMITAQDVSVEVGERIATSADGIVGTGFLTKFDFILDSGAGQFIALPPT